MKLFSRMFNTLPKRLIAGALIAAGIALPAAAVMAGQVVNIQATTGVANVTAGDTSYQSSVNATYDQVVKVEVTYYNPNPAGSNLVANGVHIKINIPNAAGTTQTITTTTAGSNTNTVNGSAVVNTGRSDAYLQYVPGSGQARVTLPNGTIQNEIIPDSEVQSAQGIAINNGNPCQAAAVAIKARVIVPGVKIVKQSEVLGQSNKWSNDNTANPGDTMVYMLTYQNIGNSTENSVVLSDNLPPKMTLVPNTTYLYNSNNPHGVNYGSDNITNGGIVIGNYGPGAIAYVTFQVKIADASNLACGVNEFRNVGIAHPQGMDQYYNTAITDVTRSCAQTPVYTCNLLSVTPGENRTVTVNNFQYTAENGASFKDVVIDWGDSSTPLTTNNAVGQTHQYANDGTYTITATAHFDVNGQDKSAGGANCTQTVSFTTPTTPGTVVTTSTPPTQLVNTGPGDVLAIFGLTTVVGAVAHRLFSRRFARR